MKLIRTLSRLLVGMLFIFSGFVKAVDPLGSTYKFTDYFDAFGLGFLSFFALPLAFILSASELLMGIGLLLAYRMKVVSWAVLLFMSFFTILTFILALFNPVTDCGCFGDALILTNWETFWKNIVLMIFTLVIFTGRKHYTPVLWPKAEWTILSFFFVCCLSLSVYCYRHLPILDFRPYRVGTNLSKATIIPPGAPADEYDTRLYYRDKSNGKIREFSISNFPRDTGWVFDHSKSVLLKKGYEPPVHDFSVSSPDGQDVTETIKNTKGFVFLLVSYNLNKADKASLVRAADYFRLTGIYSDVSFYAATASVADDISKVRNSLGLPYDFGTADEIALKTMIRSNPGLILIKDGTIIKNWHYNDFPEVREFEPALKDLARNFPFAPGTDLRKIKQRPEGARSDVFKTTLKYRKVDSDSVSEFTMDNFPHGDDWTFVSSRSEKISSGFTMPLDDFKMLTYNSEDVSEGIIQESGQIFLISVKEPHLLDPDMLEKLNKLSIAASSAPGGPFLFYAMTGLETDQIYPFTDSYISPITFCSTPLKLVESVSGNGVSLISIKNGKVTARWDNSSIPGPDKISEIISAGFHPGELETGIMPYLTSNYRTVIENGRVYIFLLGFLFLALFVRIFIEIPYYVKNGNG
jgi:hypothetical protein